MTFLVKLVDQLRDLNRRWVTTRIGFENHTSFGLPHKSNVKWDALSRLLRRPWFTRAWVVQELAVNPSVRVSCGAREVDWSYFKSLYELSRQFGLLLHRDIPGLSVVEAHEAFALMHNARKSVQGNNRLSLIQMLRATRTLASKWPQDKVFALLGLAADGARFLHHVDYTENTAAETFHGVARTLFEGGDLFGLLS